MDGSFVFSPIEPHWPKQVESVSRGSMSTYVAAKSKMCISIGVKICVHCHEIDKEEKEARRYEYVKVQERAGEPRTKRK